MSRIERIGDAALYLGDCMDVLPALSAVDAVITDPPYGVNLGQHRGANDHRSTVLQKDGYASYEDTPENFASFIAPAVASALSKASRGAVFMAWKSAWMLPPADAIGGIYLPSGMGRNSWGFASLQHCLFYGVAPDLHLGAKATAIYSTETSEKNGHPCPKPLGWMKWSVGLASRAGETVLDPFMGSGTTGVAAINMGRKFVGCEQSPEYFEIACRRLTEAHANRRLFAEVPQPQQLGIEAA